MTTLNTSNLNTPNTMASGLPYNTAYINGHSWLHAKIPAIIIFVPPKLLLLGGTDPKIYCLTSNIAKTVQYRAILTTAVYVVGL